MFLTEANAQKIVNEMKSLLGKDINIMDENAIIIASTNPVRIGSLHEGAQIMLSEGRSELIVEPGDQLKNTIPGINLAIMIDGKIAGVIGVTGAPTEVIVLGNVIKKMTELMIENQHQREDKLMLEGTRGQFIENWLFSDPKDIIDLEMRGHLLGIDTNIPRYILMIEVKSPESLVSADGLREVQNNIMLNRLKNSISYNKQNFCFIINQRIVLLICEQPKMDIKETAAKLYSEIETLAGQKVYIGVSEKASRGKNIRVCYEQAKFACKIASNGSRNIVNYGGTNPEFIVRSIPENVRHTVYDSVFKNCYPGEEQEIYETLHYYFRYDGSIAKVADELFIHRNTFQYRLHKIYEKTGYSIRAPRDAFVLYIAMLQYEIQNQK